MTYTTKQISELTGLSRSDLHKLRHGINQRNQFTGKLYKYPPLLIQGKHWDWVQGVIRFKAICVPLIMNKKVKKA